MTVIRILAKTKKLLKLIDEMGSIHLTPERRVITALDPLSEENLTIRFVKTCLLEHEVKLKSTLVTKNGMQLLSVAAPYSFDEHWITKII